MRPSKLWLDIETYSPVPISRGLYAYAAPAELLMLQYAIDDSDPVILEPHELSTTAAAEFRDAWLAPDVEIWAHNAQFERTLLSPFSTIGYPCGEKPHASRWRCTMVQAYSHSLPGSLHQLCQVLGVPEKLAKKDGDRLIRLFCCPQPTNRKLARCTKHTHPEDWELFRQYGYQDIVALREIARRLPNINYPKSEYERSLYELDQRINDRGVYTNSALITGAIRTSELHKATIKRETEAQTDGLLASTTQRDETLNYILEQYGVQLKDLTKDTVRRMLDNDELDPGLRDLLLLRKAASATTVSKYVAFQRATNADGRCRGMLQFRGASRTGRASGKVVQLQNLASRGLLSDPEIEFGVTALSEGFAHEVYPDLTHLLTSCIRSVIVPPPGRKFVVADLSNIEGRMLAWLAGEQWKLDAFTAFDQGEGHDLYNLAYVRAFGGNPEDVTKPQRDIGKVCELFLGYGGRHGAFLTGAATYGFNISDLADQVYPTLPDDTVTAAEGLLDWYISKGLSTHGLRKKEFVAVEGLVSLWRTSNSRIVALWVETKEAVLNAINNPGTVYSAGRHVKIMRNGSWLLIRLPSGRCLCYPGIQLDDENNITYRGRKWELIKTWHGQLVENITQAASADVLYAAQWPAENAGYQIVLHVHDELVTETPDKKIYTANELCEIMTLPLEWAHGLPLAAKGEETYRYKK